MLCDSKVCVSLNGFQLPKNYSTVFDSKKLRNLLLKNQSTIYYHRVNACDNINIRLIYVEKMRYMFHLFYIYSPNLYSYTRILA